MTVGDWFLVAFVSAPLAAFALLLLAEAVSGDDAPDACGACGHSRAQHSAGDCTAAGPCGCPRYEEPPREDPVPIGCGG
ncbi:hypothetical protein OOK31_06410 [Streptomyces sp. NBC_00249]|uniref:hypothetical protein n=1 Tax=Streptomyces sp. NBC_00249 TaxID=2975690 RepID=UPI00224D3F68|nr:hypothetical protein [Streptomyces sp. NBC_00249]MCX5193526.1 hypothetical protein [Streptomyces sp. NBC_00249]